MAVIFQIGCGDTLRETIPIERSLHFFKDELWTYEHVKGPKCPLVPKKSNWPFFSTSRARPKTSSNADGDGDQDWSFRRRRTWTAAELRQLTFVETSTVIGTSTAAKVETLTAAAVVIELHFNHLDGG
ncbi:unnamed protein product [Citrullus colocynthis]|uniref:Uncharacterized protein n=1 Tax=Citrullus colocynthis TaxID=252529 RepID=A0ABP0Y6P6_9ROSI